MNFKDLLIKCSCYKFVFFTHKVGHEILTGAPSLPKEGSNQVLLRRGLA